MNKYFAAALALFFVGAPAVAANSATLATAIADCCAALGTCCEEARDCCDE